MHINTLDVTSITPHRCTFEDPSWANHCSSTLDCTANLQLLKLCVTLSTLSYLILKHILLPYQIYLAVYSIKSIIK